MRKIIYALLSFIIIKLIGNRPLSLMVALVAFATTGTAQYIYQVSSQNLPAVKKKGDWQASLFYSTGGGSVEGNYDSKESLSNGVDLHGAYAISKYWAVTASFNARSEKRVFGSYTENIFGFSFSSNGSSTNYYQMNWEVGGGYFKMIEPKKRVWLQLFAGVGGGNYRMKEIAYERATGTYVPKYHQSEVFRFYLSPALHFGITENFIIGVGTKLTNVNYNKTNGDLNYYYDFENLKGKRFTFFEPCVDFKTRLKDAPWIVPNMQIGFCSGLQDYDTQNFNFSIGITVLTPEKRKSK